VTRGGWLGPVRSLSDGVRDIARVFAIDVTVCRKCGGRMRVLDVVTDPDDTSIHGHRRMLVGIGDSIEPDYALLLSRGDDREVVCVGDALCCDASHDKAPGSVLDKLSKVRRTYSNRSAWLDGAGRLVPCVGSACFVVIPHAVAVDRSKHLEEQDVQLLILSPGPAPAREASRRRMLVVLDTLAWHLDHRPPLMLPDPE
jgi:hypothetical protein